MANKTINCTVVNTTDNKSVIYNNGKTYTLKITLTNNTGKTITYNTGSSLSIYVPSFLGGDVSNMGISATGWTFANEGYYLKLTSTASAKTDFTSLSFEITGASVASSVKPTNGQSNVNLGSFTGATTTTIDYNFNLSAPPVPADLNLADYLEVNLINNEIFVSTANEPSKIANKLQLVLSNKTNELLFQGSNPWTTSPEVIVSFLYGSNAGDLATANTRATKPTTPPVGSAWNITVGKVEGEGNDWDANPSKTSSYPQWVLTPQPPPPASNLAILGAGNTDDGEITFEFDNIVSITPVGATHMVVNFQGFPHNDSKNYNPYIIYLEINKEDPKPGILKFNSVAESGKTEGAPIIPWEPQPNQGPSPIAPAWMTWATMGVYSVKLTYVPKGASGAVTVAESTCDGPINSKTGKPISTKGSPIAVNEACFGVNVYTDFPDDVTFTLSAYDVNGDPVGDNKEITFSFPTAITVTGFIFNTLAGLHSVPDVEVTAYPYAAINTQDVLFKHGVRETIILPYNVDKGDQTRIASYRLQNMDPSVTINSKSFPDTNWKVEINKSVVYDYPFSTDGKVVTDLTGLTFNVENAALYTSIGLQNNNGSDIQLAFVLGTLTIRYTDRQTNHVYRTASNIPYTISPDGFTITFTDNQSFNTPGDYLATNGAGYFADLAFSLVVTIQVGTDDPLVANSYSLVGSITAATGEKDHGTPPSIGLTFTPVA